MSYTDGVRVESYPATSARWVVPHWARFVSVDARHIRASFERFEQWTAPLASPLVMELEGRPKYVFTEANVEPIFTPVRPSMLDTRPAVTLYSAVDPLGPVDNSDSDLYWYVTGILDVGRFRNLGLGYSISKFHEGGNPVTVYSNSLRLELLDSRGNILSSWQHSAGTAGPHVGHVTFGSTAGGPLSGTTVYGTRPAFVRLGFIENATQTQVVGSVELVGLP